MNNNIDMALRTTMLYGTTVYKHNAAIFIT